jgi:CDP-diacylglycerol--serine O-phosphatidyltransferase
MPEQKARELTAEGGLETRPPRQPRRGMYVLPSLFTAGNIAAGFYAIIQSVQGSAAEPEYYNRAALAIGFAVLFDGLDGRIARMTNTSSEFGKELDSLADVITFGVAPSVLAYIWGFRLLPMSPHHDLRQRIVQAGVFICFLFLICGASRLARFNISVNPQPRNPGRPGRKYFVGMPIPAGAGVIAAVIHFYDGSPIYDLRMSAQLAVLERQGDSCRRGPASVPDGGAAGADWRASGDVLGVDADRAGAWLPGVGCVGAAGVLVGAGAASNEVARHRLGMR